MEHIDVVRNYLSAYGKGDAVMEFPVSSATVELAAQALGTEPARIAKTLSFGDKSGEGCIIIVMTGDAKVDNRKFKDYFNMKARMLSHAEALTYTGHPVGGVCPFALPAGVPVYLDISLRRFDVVYPAAGSSNSAVPMTCPELERCSKATAWLDVCKGWNTDSQEA